MDVKVIYNPNEDIDEYYKGDPIQGQRLKDSIYKLGLLENIKQIKELDTDSIDKIRNSIETFNQEAIHLFKVVNKISYKEIMLSSLKGSINIEFDLSILSIYNSADVGYNAATDQALIEIEKMIISMSKFIKNESVVLTYIDFLLEITLKRLYYSYFPNEWEDLRNFMDKMEDVKPDGEEALKEHLYKYLMRLEEFEKNIYKLNDRYEIADSLYIKIFVEVPPDRKNYLFLPSSPITKMLKDISIYKVNNTKLPTTKNVKLRENTTLMGGYILNYGAKNENYEIVVENPKLINKNQSVFFRKTLNFILIKANEQNYPTDIAFSLEEYMNSTGYKTKDTAFRGADRNFNTLLGVRVGGELKRGRNVIAKVTSNLFRSKAISYNQCLIKCEPDYIESLVSQYYTLLPIWSGLLKTKAFDIVDYIYYLARQNTAALKEKRSFNIGFKVINDKLGQPSPEETQRHTQFIINPILEAIEEIEEVQLEAKSTNLKITPKYNFNYKNAHEFLEGYLQIDLDDEALDYFTTREIDRVKKIEQSREENKLKRQLEYHKKKEKNTLLD